MIRSPPRSIQATAGLIHQAQRGYGIACQTALAHLSPHDAIAFVDGDYSAVTSQLLDLLMAWRNGADLVIVEGWCVGVPAESTDTPQPINTLEAEEERTITIDLKPIAPGRQDQWLAADDLHLNAKGR